MSRVANPNGIMASKEMKRTLFVFDFDLTLVDDNTDTWIMTICPELQIRENLRSLRRQFGCWTDLMDHVFSLISPHTNKEDILKHMSQLRLYDQAMKAVTAVRDCRNSEAIIISDANTIFIECILQECGVKEVVKEVFSNPAQFEPDGRLRVKRYHSHSCVTCAHSPNLCKGSVLGEYLNANPGYEKIVFVGDGRGDFCPAISLRRQDTIVCREGYPLAKLLSSVSSQGQSSQSVRQAGDEGASSFSCEATVHVIDFVKSLGDIISAECG